MWDETLIESQRRSNSKRAIIVFTLSIFFHLSLVLVLFIGYFSYVDTVEASFIPITFMRAMEPPPPPPAAVKRNSKKPPKKAALEQPTEIPDKIEDQPPPSDTEVADQGVTDVDGVEGGLEGGVEGGELLVPAGGMIANLPAGFLSSSNALGEAAPPKVSGTIVRPFRVKTIRPEYPASVQKAHVEGIVWLQVSISETGRCEDIVIIRSLHPVLDECAIRAVQQWKYRPAMLNKRPIRVLVTIAVKFTIERHTAGF